MNIYTQIKLLALKSGKTLTEEQIKSIYNSFLASPEKTNTVLLTLIDQA